MSRPGRLVRDAASLLATHAAAAAVPRMPPRARRGLGRAVGVLAAGVLRADRRLVAEELRASLGPGEVSPRLLRRSFAHIWLDGVEPHLYPYLGPHNIDQLVRLEGERHLREALEPGRGVLLLIGHLGLNTLVMAALGHRGYRIHQLGAPPPVWREILGPENVSPLAYRRYQRTWRNEQALPARHISVFAFLRPAYRALKQGDILCVAVDGGGGTRWVEVSFLGRRCNVSSGPATLAVRTGAAALPAFVVRGDDGRHRMILEPPLAVGEGDRDEQVRDLTQRFMARLEHWVRRHPEQYAGFLRLRRRAAATDGRPFFTDYAGGRGG